MSAQPVGQVIAVAARGGEVEDGRVGVPVEVACDAVCHLAPVWVGVHDDDHAAAGEHGCPVRLPGLARSMRDRVALRCRLLRGIVEVRLGAILIPLRASLSADYHD